MNLNRFDILEFKNWITDHILLMAGFSIRLKIINNHNKHIKVTG